MSPRAKSLGTLIRHYIDQIDRDLEAAYLATGLDWRPRYTPVLRALMSIGPASIRTLSNIIGITHGAISQTVAQMEKRGLVELQKGNDARERIVQITSKTEAMIPALQWHWDVAIAVTMGIDADLSTPISTVMLEAIDALNLVPYKDRFQRAAEVMPPMPIPFDRNSLPEESL